MREVDADIELPDEQELEAARIEDFQRGRQIGWGKVESACKSVVARRLKGAVMCRREAGTTAVCQLRALYKSKLRTAYWTRSAVP